MPRRKQDIATSVTVADSDPWRAFLEAMHLTGGITVEPASTAAVSPISEKEREDFDTFLNEALKIDRESYEAQTARDPGLKTAVEQAYITWKRKRTS
jgi:hypothetical protein